MTEKTKEYYRQYRKKYYQKNKEKFKEYHKKWRKENNEKWNELCFNARERRVAKLISEGCINPWTVINKKGEPKYETEQYAR